MKKIIFLFTLLNLSFCMRGSDFELWDLNNNLDDINRELWMRNLLLEKQNSILQEKNDLERKRLQQEEEKAIAEKIQSRRSAAIQNSLPMRKKARESALEFFDRQKRPVLFIVDHRYIYSWAGEPIGYLVPGDTKEYEVVEHKGGYGFLKDDIIYDSNKKILCVGSRYLPKGFDLKNLVRNPPHHDFYEKSENSYPGYNFVRAPKFLLEWSIQGNFLFYRRVFTDDDRTSLMINRAIQQYRAQLAEKKKKMYKRMKRAYR